MGRSPRLSPHRRSVLEARAQEKRGVLTRSEEALWHRLRAGQLGVMFRRQVVIAGFIVDFAAPEVRLVVEVDGAWHVGRETKDARRDRRLERAGWRVLRLGAELVLGELEGAVARVLEAVEGG